MRNTIWQSLTTGVLAVAVIAGTGRAQEPAEAPSGLALAAAMEQSLQAAIAKAEKSVVAIARVKHSKNVINGLAADQRNQPFGFTMPSSSEPDPMSPDFVPSEFGTGVIIDRTGLILTTCDVLGDLEEDAEQEFFVTAVDRKVRAAKIEAADPRSNLAVLKVEGSDLTPITFGDGGKLRKGQIVLALGNPYAIARDGQVSASWGIVANLQRKAGRASDETLQSGKTTLHHLGTLIQTDAKLNLGTSGGALLNLQGEMVGLTTSMAATAGYEQAAGYAIPVDDTFRRILDDLRNGRAVEYGFLGVAPNLSLAARQFGVPGVMVQDVIRGAPAEQAGIQPGDVITRVAGKEVHDFDSLVLQVGSHPAGEQVELTVERNGRLMPVKSTLAKARVHGKPIVTQPVPDWRGLQVDYWTAIVEFRIDQEQMQNVDFDGCVIVTGVQPDSTAAKAGLKPGMTITHVDGGRVSSPKEFRAAVESLSGSVPLRIAGATIDAASEMIVAAE